MKNALIVILFFAINFTSLAQQFSPAYVVTVTHDTINGFIRYDTDAELATSVTFRKSKTGTETIYTPGDLVGFAFDNGRTFNRFTSGTTPDNAPVYVFAKKLVTGKLNVYSYSKRRKTRADYFLVNNELSNTFLLTEPEKVRKEVDGRVGVGESSRHLGMIRLAKGDTVPDLSTPGRMKYREDVILYDIKDYNDTYRNEYPVAQYKPRKKIEHAVAAGIPFTKVEPGETVFRGSYYRLKYLPERSRTLSFIRGISYSYRDSEEPIPTDKNTISVDFRQQMISLIPMGIHVQGDGRTIKPYVYAGLGILVIVDTGYRMNNGEYLGTKNEYWGTFTANLGAGLKIKAGSNYIITEVTPGAHGLFVNLGFVF